MVSVKIKTGRPPGYPKSGGRKKGTPNKGFTVLDQLLAHGKVPIDEIMKLMPKVDPNLQMQSWLKLLQYCYAALRSIEVKGDIEHSLKVTPENVQELCRLARQSSPSQLIGDTLMEEITKDDEDDGDADSDTTDREPHTIDVSCGQAYDLGMGD